MKTIKARVTLYVPDKLYGFAKDPDSGEQVFFHLGDFRWLANVPLPPPVMGEWVEAEYDPSQTQRGSAPKARRVARVNQPDELQGEVETFDVVKGYGFVAGDDGKSYYLHRSDMDDDNLIPVQGDRVQFWAGYKRGKPRACYVRIVK